jgi:hypothetical protein
MSELNDRVMHCHPSWDPDVMSGQKPPVRYGVVVEVYYGKPSAHTRGVKLLGIQFDDGTIERGFIDGVSVKPVPLQMPTFNVATE